MSNSDQLTLLHAKKGALFTRMQLICKHSRDVENPSVREAFLDELETVQTLRSDFEKIIDKINTLELEENENYVVNYQPLLSFEDLFCRVQRVAKTLTSSQDQDAKPVVVQPRSERPKLPRIEIPEFNGDPSAWPFFFASFKNTVHDNAFLSDSEKLYYLIGRLTGKAKQVCAGVTPCAENYLLIFQALVNKYEDTRLLATTYLDNIFNLKPLTNVNSNNLDQFVDSFSASVAALKNLKMKDLSDFLFLYTAMKKLDSETARTFELNKRSSDIPSFEDLISFLRDHVKILQRTSVSEGTKKSDRRSEDASKPRKFTQSYVNTEIEPTTSQQCSLCKLQHDQLYKCPGFQRMTAFERYKFVKANNYCFNCLSDKHKFSMCKSGLQCRKCHNAHHTMLHFDQPNATSTSTSTRASFAVTTSECVPNEMACEPIEGPPVQLPELSGLTSTPLLQLPERLPCESIDDVTLCSLSDKAASCAPPTTVLLATARVVALDKSGKEHMLRVLLDSASQSNFITGNCCKRLGLEASLKPSTSMVKGIGGSSKATQGTVNVAFHSRFNRNVSFEVGSLVVDRVTDCLPSAEINVAALSEFASLPLADDTYSIPGEIDMLIGASLYPHLLLPHYVRGQSTSSPCALHTVLGYVLMGTAPIRATSSTTYSFCCSVQPLDSIVRRFWELEEVNASPLLSPDDKLCEDIYVNTTTREPDGRYTVALPFKGDVSTLGNSMAMAKKRFFCLERKLQASPKLKQAYDGAINEYLDKGYLSLAPLAVDAQDEPSYTIPHHGVIREDKVTSKLRIVLDASAKTDKSVSLNEILHNGENLQGNLFNIILNFRLFKIGMSADIRHMFLCIGVREEDRKYQQILYRFDPQEPLAVYRFNRVCFGLKCSPFHALRTMRQLMSDEGRDFPLAQKSMETGLYMDDYVHSVDCEQEGKETAAEVISLMKRGHFDLVKWSSNSAGVMASVPPSHRLSSVKEFDEGESQKVLGLCWSPNSDAFSLKICTPPEKCTKRTILSCVAKIWDVMGFVAPVVLYAKLLIKQLWLCDCDWDDSPPENIVKLWMQFRDELPQINMIEIPRHVGITRASVVTVVGFSDASERAYGGVVYLNVRNDDTTSIHLVSAKSRVSPVKNVSLARLELCAALLLARLIRTIIDACSNRIAIDSIFAFSDSTVALCWIHSSPHRWNTFVANRVTKIQADVSQSHFYHVSGKENPADCLSRGLTPSQIVEHPLWFTGPSWAVLNPSEWPISTFNPSTVSEPPEEKGVSLVTGVVSEESAIITLARRMSSWSKLLRSLVYVYRFLKKLPLNKHVSASDLEFVELRVLRVVQNEYFADEIRTLIDGKICKRAIQRLNPFLDNEGLVRVGGRLRESDLGYNQKHPILLPKDHHVVDILIDDCHKANFHAGPNLLLSILRQKYWILSGRKLLRARIYRCVSCFRARPKPDFPQMADLKLCRVNQSAKPFAHTAVDFAGPFKVTLTRGRGVRSTKAYVCLFVCLTTRAVHIELAGDLSTASFMSAFKRFLSRRGPVSQMYSDNGTNFVGAKRALSELDTLLQSAHYNTEFMHELARNRIAWTFNPPAASHFGGDWEANVKSFKTHLYRAIGEQVLSFEELSTVLAQVEAVMNTRPLCRTLSSDPSEPLALTPAHFLNYTPLKILPAPSVETDNLRLLSRHTLLDGLVQSFWKRWRSEYLHTLQLRQKWNTSTNPITVGTVVILKVDNAPPLHWPLAVVEEVFPGNDGIIRVVRIRTATGNYTRPVVRLCPLPNQ